MLIIIGVFLIFANLSLLRKDCPPQKIEYRFIPRTFKETQDTPVEISEIFKTMFERPTPFLQSFSGKQQGKAEANINKFFISQS